MAGCGTGRAGAGTETDGGGTGIGGGGVSWSVGGGGMGSGATGETGAVVTPMEGPAGAEAIDNGYEYSGVLREMPLANLAMMKMPAEISTITPRMEA